MKFLILLIGIYSSNLWPVQPCLGRRQVIIESLTTNHPYFPGVGRVELTLTPKGHLECLFLFPPQENKKPYQYTLEEVNLGQPLNAMKLLGFDLAHLYLPENEALISAQEGGFLMISIRKNLANERFEFLLELRRFGGSWEVWLANERVNSIFIRSKGIYLVEDVVFRNSDT